MVRGSLGEELWSSSTLSAPDLKPRGVVVNMIPGLPAHILFMCVRYADSLNDANMLKSLMNSTINGIKQVVKVGTVFDIGYWYYKSFRNTCGNDQVPILHLQALVNHVIPQTSLRPSR